MTNLSSDSTALITNQTLPMMANAYRAAVATLEDCLARLAEAEQALCAAFGKGEYASDNQFAVGDIIRAKHGSTDPKELEQTWRQTAWRILVDRLELRRIASVKRVEEIDRQLQDPKALPEISEATMLAMIEGNAQNVGAFLQEAVVECFEKLRPWHRGELGDGYKTNQIWQVGEKVVLSYACERGYGAAGTFRVSYCGSKTSLLRCLDNVMHLLDGKGPVPTHAGPLVDALNGKENFGQVETEYFEARCFKNRNIHLRFKRLDLVAELNRRGSNGAPQLPGRR